MGFPKQICWFEDVVRSVRSGYRVHAKNVRTMLELCYENPLFFLNNCYRTGLKCIYLAIAFNNVFLIYGIFFLKISFENGF